MIFDLEVAFEKFSLKINIIIDLDVEINGFHIAFVLRQIFVTINYVVFS